MLRIGQVEATATQDGKYTDGSVAGGIAATRLRAAAFNAMQEELAHIVESAGLALDINDMTQVLKAIQKLTLSRANPFADIKSDGAAAISTALTNLGLTNAIIGDTCKEAGFYSGSALAPYLMHEDTHTPIRLVTLDSVHRVTTTTYTINYYANGLIHILGMTPTVSSLTPKTMTFPVAFPNACIRFALHNQESGVPSYNMAMYSNLSRTGAKIWGVANILGNSGSPTLGALPDAEISYEAWGY
ncbi:gp53-like domain-containing protein [Escherichia coli]|uniref:Putative tail fiber protein gp53-like C-terminal domain-containing protein n=3 Tax=Escherichia coli TaxID=562 RepID=A0ABD5CAD1_ECOLX|nr:hypothetical protein [Escherichia coli]MCF3339744.1 hypothetical protein [Escherichia coli]MDA6492535.1 hypothetical protein [Escherichia coli]MDF1376257.1 hypothetical protein [Escherichia coli]MDR5966637.1 hypothetical protein [Escherichia coli]MDR6020241.1 hypothetical protein [Escherichia coli]